MTRCTPPSLRTIALLLIAGSSLDEAAAFPQQPPPWVANEEAELQPGNLAPDDQFGHAVAVHGDVAVVGAPEDDFPFAARAGSAHVFVRSGASWVLQQQLTASDKSVNDRFGSSVAIAGDTLVVGAPGKVAPGIGGGAGAVYVFVRSGTSWVEQQKLMASDPAVSVRLGSAVGLDGDTIVAGTGDDNVPVVPAAGVAYVFRRSGGAWAEEAQLSTAGAGGMDRFGRQVAISGQTIAVGAYLADLPNGQDEGAAYVFVRTGTTWSEEAELVASDADAAAFFGFSIALSGDRVLVGATGDGEAGYNAGAAYVFTRDGSSWSEEQKLLAQGLDDGAFFGSSVALSGDTAVIAAPQAVSSELAATYVFARDASGWAERLVLVASNPNVYLGTSVAVMGNTAIAGAYVGWSPELFPDSAHVFRLCPPPASYCTPGTSASGCQALLSATGTPSASAASGFLLEAAGVEGDVNGHFYFGTHGRQANSWGNGTSFQCVVPPTKRAGTLSGSGTKDQCDGSFAQDLNAVWCPTCPKPHKNPGAGAVVQAQLWYRDPHNTSNQKTSLSDAIEFCLSP